jgi:hypothetical protein
MLDLTHYAQEGFDAPPGAQPVHVLGSSAFVAWRVGQWLRQHGGVRPTRVLDEPGYAVRVDGVRVVVPMGATGIPRVESD